MAKQNDKNQAVPQKFITGGTSREKISTITSTSSSNNQIVESPRLTYVHTPNKYRDKVTTNIIEETIRKKQNTKDNDRDHDISSKYNITDTITTIETKGQTEQSSHDLENGDDSKQNHDVQKGSEGPQRH